jgi:pimeloyl-ACP methyl ester carboxylesterase
MSRSTSHRFIRRLESGAGGPPVVLEAGLNGGADTWQRVIPMLEPYVRVVAYDRAGIGGSDSAPDLPTIERQVEDLTSIITGLDAGPAVLAGHSWGGILVQLLAFRSPELVAGLVLVDPGHEEMERGLPLPLQWAMKGMRLVVRDELSADPDVTEAALKEMRAAERPFPDVPVVVMSAAEGYPRGFREYWTGLQKDLVAAAPRARHVVVEDSGHQVPVVRPDLVANTILSVVTQLRAENTV